MLLYTLKKSLHFFLVNILSSFLILNSFAATKANYKDELKAQALDEINSHKYTYQGWVNFLKKENILKTKELEDYLDQNSKAKEMVLPALHYEDGKISFPVEGKKVYFSFVNAHETLVEFQGKSVKFNDQMTFLEVKGKIDPLFQVSKTTFFDFFIQSAHAELLLLGVMIAGALFLYTAQKGINWYIESTTLKVVTEKIQNALTICSDSTQVSDNDPTVATDLAKTMKSINWWYLNECVTYDIKSKKGLKPKFCPKLEETKKCIEDKMKELKNKERTSDGPRKTRPKESQGAESSPAPASSSMKK